MRLLMCILMHDRFLVLAILSWAASPGFFAVEVSGATSCRMSLKRTFSDT
jgi:hypothetical protein